MIDELAIDFTYAWLRLTGRAKPAEVGGRGYTRQDLSGMAAVFIPAWDEDAVVGPTLAYAPASLPQDDVRRTVGCFRNDPATIASVAVAARHDDRICVVNVGEDEPISEAHCLNRLYQALCDDGAGLRTKAHMVVLHDAEDMVDPVVLVLLNRPIWQEDLVQLPVTALPRPDSPLICAWARCPHASRSTTGSAVPAMPSPETDRLSPFRRAFDTVQL